MITVNVNNKTKKFNSINELIEDLYYDLGTIDDLNIQNEISKNTELFPMFDIFTENIILVNDEQIYDKLLTFHYRHINKHTIELINKINKPKLINFLKNYNLDILDETFYKIIYHNNPNTENLTTCVRPSFLPIFRYSNPYYSKSELIYLALNNGLWHSDYNLDDICSTVKENDVSGNKLLEHQLFIRENSADNYIKYYSFLGSSPFNNYLRFPNYHIKDNVIENHINNFNAILIKSPEWDKSYYFYRWINNDDFLKKLKIDDIWLDYGFLSTTRQPFVDPDNNYFGYILVKIKVPANVPGCGLAIEYYSHFPEEQEIVFPPSKFKLINNEHTTYHHPNKLVQDKIKSKYEFEWIGHIDEYIQNNKLINEKQMINYLDSNIDGSTTYEKLDNFLKKYKKFYVKIGSIDVLFNVAKIESGAYDSFFYMNKLDEDSRVLTLDKDIFITWENDKTGEINLLIEIGTVISVNYYHKFNPNLSYIIDKLNYDDVINFIMKLSNMFNIDKIIIHPSHNKYWSLINKPNNILNVTTDTSFYSYKIDRLKSGETYHDRQMYNSDCFYFNEALQHLIFNAYMIPDNISKFTKQMFNDGKCKLTYSLEAILYLLNTPLNEFLAALSEKNVMYDSFVELTIKIANKLLMEKTKIVNQLKYIKQAKRKITPGYKLIDLYVYIFIHYYYLIPYLHNILFDKFNINLNETYYVLNTDDNNIFSIVDFNKLNELKNQSLKRVVLQKRQYKIKIK